MNNKENKRISVDALNKYYKKQDSSVGEVTIEIGDGIAIHVRENITANQFVTAVEAGVASCFADDEYLPWLKDVAVYARCAGLHLLILILMRQIWSQSSSL